MLKVIKNIKLGDFITVSDVTGRATEMSLLHVEVQTEQSDLVMIPNILMVTQPVKVVRSSGTIISIDVSLGYDIEHSKTLALSYLAVDDTGYRMVLFKLESWVTLELPIERLDALKAH
jgi:small-conductance mechanosensitive channel